MVQVKNLSKSFGAKDNNYKVLHNISFDLEEGSFTAILGTSGCGKSTLMKCMSGIEKADEGEILYGDLNLCQLGIEEKKKFRREHIGMVFQDFDLLPILNVKENILLPLKLNHMKLDEAYFEKLVSVLGIKEKLHNRISELSGGQQQRVAIVRALITRPQIIYADEPTGNLDHKNTQEVVHLLKEINRELHTTILMITHDLEVANVADQVLELEDGRLVKI